MRASFSIPKISCTCFLIMVNPKRLVTKAKKGITLMRYNSHSSSCNDESTTMIADKGHFVVYTVDHTRFMVPLLLLKNHSFQELLRMSEEEFGLPRSGPIRLGCDAAFMEYVLFLLNRSMSKDVERALLASLDANRCLSSSSGHPARCQQGIAA